jgi:hypothetical protein
MSVIKMRTTLYTGCFKTMFSNLNAYINYSEDMYSILRCHNVEKHTEFYLGNLRFNLTSTGNVGCFKISAAMTFQILLYGECYESFTLKGVHTTGYR